MRKEVRAYAKIVGPGWEHYMTKPKIILGRGGENVECDVVVSIESAVSRQHFSIRFAPELQAFEVENLSKNGILVNGEFVHRLSPPVLLRSQADIAFGRRDPMCISFLLPSGIKASVKKKEVPSEKTLPLLQWIGEAIILHGPLTAAQLRKVIDEAHPHQFRKMGGDHIVSSSIRHILTQNDQIFFAADSIAIENGWATVPFPAKDGKVTDAYFKVHEDQKSRFYSLISAEEQALHKDGVCKHADSKQLHQPQRAKNTSARTPTAQPPV